MVIGKGYNTFIGLGKENVWGEAAAISKFLKHTSESIEETEEKEFGGGLYAPNIEEDDVIQTTRGVSGGFELNARWEDLDLLYKFAFGQAPTNTIPDPTNAATAYQHVYTISDDLNLGKGLTIEACRDVQSLIAEGCKIRSITFTQAKRMPLVIAVDIVGELGNYAAKSTPSFTTTKIIKFSDAVSTFVFYAGSQLPIQNFEITLTNPLDEDYNLLPDRVVSEPCRNDTVMVEGSFEANFDSVAERDDFIASQSRALIAKWEGEVIGGAIKQTLQIDCPAIKIISFSNPPADKGRIIETMSFKGFKSGSDKEMKLTVINTTVSV